MTKFNNNNNNNNFIYKSALSLKHRFRCFNWTKALKKGITRKKEIVDVKTK